MEKIRPVAGGQTDDEGKDIFVPPVQLDGAPVYVVITISLLVTFADIGQTAFEVISTVIFDPAAKEVGEKVAPVAPLIFVPLFFH